MKKLFAVLMAASLVGFIACSAPAESNEAEESSEVMDEMESSMDEATTEDSEMAEEATEGTEMTEEATEEATEEVAE